MLVSLSGDTFTYEEVLNNVFVYHHDGSVIQQDQIEMSVEDGAQAISISIDLFILKVDKSAPKLAPDSSMTFTLPEGKSEIYYSVQYHSIYILGACLDSCVV